MISLVAGFDSKENSYITGQHSHIVKELEEEVGDFYALVTAVSEQGSLVGM